MDKICDKLAQRNQIWSGFLEEMHIDRKCPLQPVRNDLRSFFPDIYVYRLTTYYVHMYVCTYVGKYVCMYDVCMYVCMYVRTYVCMYVLT